MKPTTLSVEFRALQQFWRWALDEDEVDRSPMERMKARELRDIERRMALEEKARTAFLQGAEATTARPGGGQ